MNLKWSNKSSSFLTNPLVIIGAAVAVIFFFDPFGIKTWIYKELGI